MKRKYSQYIKKLFKEKFKKEFPNFKFWKSTRQQGLDYNFVDSTGENWKMISIQNDKDGNAFTVEVFWSEIEEPCLYESTLFSNMELETPLQLEDKIWKSVDRVRIRLSEFWMDDFGPWWAIDPTGKIMNSIEKHGYITSDVYFHFLSKDTFLSDAKDLTEEEIKQYVDHLVSNVIELLKKYAIPLFEYLDSK